MRKLSIQALFIILLGSSIISSCGLGRYKPSDYISTTGIAESGQETKIGLDDGAGIVIPADSIEQQVNVTIERNPEKTKNLPPFPDDVVQIGDFYNFEISGGEITNSVDLILPFDESKIPDGEGLLTIAYPTKEGWEFIPVDSKNGKVTFSTANVGDPIIAWHFVYGQIDLPNRQEQAPLQVCGEYIPLEISPETGAVGTEIKIKGQVLPVRKGVPRWQENWGNLLNLKPASNVPVTIYFGSNYINGSYGNINVTTNHDGNFETSYVVKNEGYGVHITAKAQCDKWFGTIPVPSEGRVYFRLTQPVIEQPATPQPTESPVVEQPTETPIPAGAVLLLDFVGQSIDDAINWLELNGFKYTWIDGSSPYDLGVVYKQAPAGGQYKVPHRTTVVLYRTNEKVIDPCAIMSLTPEECANNGLHQYVSTSCKSDTIINADSKFGCTCKGITLGGTHKSTFNFLGSGILEGGKGEKYSFIETNTYGITLSYSDGEGGQYTAEMVILFSLDGYQTTSISTRVGSTGTIACKDVFQFKFSE